MKSYTIQLVFAVTIILIGNYGANAFESNSFEFGSTYTECWQKLSKASVKNLITEWEKKDGSPISEKVISFDSSFSSEKDVWTRLHFTPKSGKLYLITHSFWSKDAQNKILYFNRKFSEKYKPDFPVEKAFNSSRQGEDLIGTFSQSYHSPKGLIVALTGSFIFDGEMSSKSYPITIVYSTVYMQNISQKERDELEMNYSNGL